MLKKTRAKTDLHDKKREEQKGNGGILSEEGQLSS